jgi:C1A family cysteine protease
MYADWLAEYNGTQPIYVSEPFELEKKKKKATQTRYDVFYAKVQSIAATNSDPESPFTRGLNMYSDWSSTELTSYYGLASQGNNGYCGTESEIVFTNSFDQIPSSTDWTKVNKMTPPVSDQGNCGSAWAFAAIGAIEATYVKKYGSGISLSAQELIDCSNNRYTNGCGGGLAAGAIDYIYSIETVGLQNDTKNSPYLGYEDVCYHNDSEAGIQVWNGTYLMANATIMQ